MPNFVDPLDTHCVFVSSGFSFVNIVRVMGCI